MNLFTFLNANNYQTYNRELAKAVGLGTAIFLSEVLDKFQFFQKEGSLVEGEWFYLTFESVYERTSLSRREQEVAIKNLVERKLIESKIKGLPAKRYFRLIKENITSLLEVTNWNVTNDKLECKKLQTHIIYKNPKEEPKEETPSECAPALSGVASEGSEAAQRLSEMFLGKSKELKSDTTRKIISSWLKSFKSLLKKRTEKQLEELISWIFLDSFWKNVIVAPSGMEKHLEKIELKMQQEQTQKAINPAFNKQKEVEIAQKYALLPVECTKKVLGGSEVVLRLDSVFKSLLSHKARYSSEEIYQAWQEFLAYQGPISDTKRLFEGILEHRRKAVWNQPAASTTKNSKKEEQSSLETSKENSSESDTKDLAFPNVALFLSAMEK